MDLDSYDEAILMALSADGRMPITELSRRIGLTKTPRLARVKRLETTGVIRGYMAVLDPVKLGRNHVAFVQVTLSETRAVALDAFNEAVMALEEIEQ